MAEHSGFFDAKYVDGKYDRMYYAEDFAKYFANFIGNGVFEENMGELVVTQEDNPSMNIKVLSGQAFINGYRYENDDDYFLAIDVASGSLNRIDLVVLRFNVLERKINLFVKKGTAAVTALPPSVQRDADVYELKLAEIHVKAGATNIVQSSITDTRTDKDVCGFVRTIPDKELRKIVSDFEEIRKTNNEMREDVNSLQRNLSIESESFPGCFYRIASNGETEWLNPPDEVGVEYRTTERWGGNPVYQRKFSIAALPAASSTPLVVSTGIPAGTIVAIESFAFDTTDKYFYPFPLMKSVSSASCTISHIRTTGDMIIYSSVGLASCQAFVRLKYVKN